MEPIKRKRVTRVGSGAFSIYLPKKWIDSWAPEPDADRQVDLHVINDSLLIVPAGLERILERTIAPQTELMTWTILSAYARGLDQCTLTPSQGQFGNDVISAARDLMRHLDERIVATCTPDTIQFHLDPDLPPPAANGADILRTMGAKVREMVGLAAEAVDAFGHDPDRCLHAMRLLELTQREDVQRLLYQALRSVARIELPLATVSDFQYLDLLASHLERMGGHLVRMVDTLLFEYGLKRRDLEYPRDHLLERMTVLPPLQGPAQEMVSGFRKDFAAIDAMIEKALNAAQTKSPEMLPEIIRLAEKTQASIGSHVFEAIMQYWGQETAEENARAAFAMSKIGSLMADVLHALQSVARHAIILTTADEA